MYPYVALRGPTYRENSHASHTWHPQSHQTACFKGSVAPAVWVRFPSPAPESHPVRRPLATIGSSAGWRLVSRQAKRTASTSSGAIRPSPAVCSSAAAAFAKTRAETFAAAPRMTCACVTIVLASPRVAAASRATTCSSMVVALHVKPDKTPALKRETFTA